MAYLLKGHTEECEISDYLVVYPFKFDANSNLLAQPHRATAFVSAITTQVAVGSERQRESDWVSNETNFEIANDDPSYGGTVLSLSDFQARFVSTPASLDRNVATWMLRGQSVPGVSVDFTPIRSEFPNFGEDRDGRAYWGGTLDSMGKVYLQASLSAPIYRMPDGYVREYCALGPAGTGDDSIFNWIVDNGVPPTPATSGGVSAYPAGLLSTLTLEDLRTRGKNAFFGSVSGGMAQAKLASGAVFVMNGLSLRASWRALAGFVRDAATCDDDDLCRLLERLPAWDLYQSADGTALRDRSSTEEFAIKTEDFEGIVLWNLESRGTAAETIHR